MKKTITMLTLITTLFSCTVNEKIMQPITISKNIADTKPPVQVKTTTHRLYILFIPIIRVGAKTFDGRDAKAYEKLLRKTNSDGVTTARYLHKKFCVPLILINYSYRSTTLTATPFSLITDTLKK